MSITKIFCKDCGTPFYYGDHAERSDRMAGRSAPERCGSCRGLHRKEFSALGVSHSDVLQLRTDGSGGLSRFARDREPARAVSTRNLEIEPFPINKIVPDLIDGLLKGEKRGGLQVQRGNDRRGARAQRQHRHHTEPAQARPAPFSEPSRDIASATVDAKTFSGFFGGEEHVAQYVSDGFTYPILDVFSDESIAHWAGGLSPEKGFDGGFWEKLDDKTIDDNGLGPRKCFRCKLYDGFRLRYYPEFESLVFQGTMTPQEKERLSRVNDDSGWKDAVESLYSNGNAKRVVGDGLEVSIGESVRGKLPPQKPSNPYTMVDPNVKARLVHAVADTVCRIVARDEEEAARRKSRWERRDAYEWHKLEKPNPIVKSPKLTVMNNSVLRKANPLEVLNLVVESYVECYKAAEWGKTERARIQASEKTALEEIKAKKEMFMAYLDKSFDERKGNFERLFGILDRAIDRNDPDTAAQALASITELGKSSPFRT